MHAFSCIEARTLFASLALLTCSKVMAFSTVQPFNGCTFYKPRFASSFKSCADFTVERGRNGCRKVKGPCPACWHYSGDDLQMWLPDYFIEITPNVGQSIFSESADGIALKAQLALAAKWQQSITQVPTLSTLSNGASTMSGADTMWHARILTIPYGAEANTFSPLPLSRGSGLPACYSGISEFLTSQWTFNFADAPFAAAWSMFGSGLCLSMVGGGVVAGIDTVRANVSRVASRLNNAVSTPVDGCASPVVLEEALAKNALPTADTLAPLSDISKLCMGTWGNLVPRSGWVGTTDAFLSAMIAAYKFSSLAGDMHLNSDLKPRLDDKWQIVYPPKASTSCFRPGSEEAMGAALSPENMVTRLGEKGALVGSYIIAVWRRRNSCEEPMTPFWKAEYSANLAKNEALCAAVGSL